MRRHHGSLETMRFDGGRLGSDLATTSRNVPGSLTSLPPPPMPHTTREPRSAVSSPSGLHFRHHLITRLPTSATRGRSAEHGRVTEAECLSIVLRPAVNLLDFWNAATQGRSCVPRPSLPCPARSSRREHASDRTVIRCHDVFDSRAAQRRAAPYRTLSGRSRAGTTLFNSILFSGRCRCRCKIILLIIRTTSGGPDEPIHTLAVSPSGMGRSAAEQFSDLAKLLFRRRTPSQNPRLQ